MSTVESDTLYVVVMESPTATQAVMGLTIPFNKQKGSVTGTVVFEGRYLDMLEDGCEGILEYLSENGK